ncbi:TetR/AcrR family transcriptional regulator [Paramicrobacterium fandaimingii]|uniref:TetR/AcrR family transcriptional regulator n=1 Tax=Paramicrobacterium fandaimingii TaxID=2708079 RepID=UPI001F1FD9FF|nr:TetR/AcrR family transcriptional regulator [Microbacterium fandaimingii]
MIEDTRVDSPTHTGAAIVDAAARLLQEQGAAAVTTRNVAKEAGVQPPTIYRLFGDKDGLLDAVAESVMATFVAAKSAVVDAAAADDVDPVDDLRAGWATQIEFGLANPVLFTLMNNPGRGTDSPATRAGGEILRRRVHRVAEAGRLRVGEERAVALIRSAGTGAVFTLLTTTPGDRDPELATAMFDAVLREIISNAPEQADDTRITTVVAMRAIAPTLTELSSAERQLLAEWLDRSIDRA